MKREDNERNEEGAGSEIGSDTAAKTGTADRQTDKGAVDAEHGESMATRPRIRALDRD
jgi:hypothetical protein